jgi:E3 ubiquitin-protein ligase SHPRH
MVETLSIHYENVTTSLGRYLPTYGRSHLVTALNLGLLERVLEEECPQDAISAGKKRSSGQGRPQRSKKRTKLPNGSHTPSQVSQYPAVPEPKPFRLDGVDESLMEDTAAVLEHVLDVRYAGLTPDKHPKLLELLEKFDSPTTISLGAVELGELDGRVVAAGEDWLMVVPQVKDGVDEDEDDYTTPSVDLISACTTLVRAGKVTLAASASLLVEDASSFHIQLTVLISLSLPYIFHRLSQKESRRHFDLVEQAQRRLLSHVFSPKPSEANHDVNIAYFYSILQSAPGLLPAVDDAMQPDLLNPTLLPFQRRSVGWLLHREGMNVTRRGEIEPNPHLGEFSFWTPASGGNHTWHYNPLSGVLISHPPEESPVALGGILAEEPGLGKTLEMISLILLHPPDESRNPTVTRWDPEARLNVKAVKVGLPFSPGISC